MVELRLVSPRPRRFAACAILTAITTVCLAGLLMLVAADSSVHHFGYYHHLTLSQQQQQQQNRSNCRRVGTAQNQCHFVRVHCQDEDGDSLIPYMNLYYCLLSHTRLAFWVLIVTWLGLLFATIGICAGDFLAPNLARLSRALNLSDTLAGVTLLALGNGAPDIFSTWSSVRSGNLDLAIGELIGAACFISTVISGSMALIKPFAVCGSTLVRDTLFLVVAMAGILALLLTRQVRLWEGVLMIAMYVLYVVVVVAPAAWRQRKSKAANKVTQSAGDTSRQNSNETQPLIAPHSQDLEASGSGSLIPGHHEQESSSVDSQELHRWLLRQHRCIEGRQEYLKQPSLPTTLKYRSRKAAAVRTAQITEEEPSGNRVSESTPPSDVRTHESTAKLIFTKLFPNLSECSKRHPWHAFFNVAMAVPSCALKITIPVIDDVPDECICDDTLALGCWDRLLLLVQGFVTPQLFCALLWRNNPHAISFRSWLRPAAACFAGSALFAIILLVFTSAHARPRYLWLVSILGFVTSALWLSTIADEVVAILKVFGIITTIPNSVLGFTVFAIGNSLDDFAADVTVAQHGHPMMAMSACFGGPLLNILLGLGSSTVYQMVRQGAVSIPLEMDLPLVISTIFLSVILPILMCCLYLAKWKMVKLIGIGLICGWFMLSITNVVIILV